jgi:hypothetical protein
VQISFYLLVRSTVTITDQLLGHLADKSDRETGPASFSTQLSATKLSEELLPAQLASP